MTPYDRQAHRLEQWLKRLAWTLGLSALLVIGLYWAVQVMAPPSPLVHQAPLHVLPNHLKPVP